uniref:Uncharacterized protein n=1 Tax=Opuntia streptacantha TaxID=393608 RepID=A0A7C8ZV58_OPUST
MNSCKPKKKIKLTDGEFLQTNIDQNQHNQPQSAPTHKKTQHHPQSTTQNRKKKSVKFTSSGHIFGWVNIPITNEFLQTQKKIIKLTDGEFLQTNIDQNQHNQPQSAPTHKKTQHHPQSTTQNRKKEL